MYTLHIADKNYSSWSLRPWLLLEMLGIPFTEKLHHLPAPGAGFGGLTPSGLVPALDTGDWSVWESLAIVEYLADRHHGVWPAAEPARAWARSAAAEMHAGFPHLRSACTMNIGVRVRLRIVSAGLARDLARLDTLWQDGLDRFGGPFLAGSAFTAVDAFYAPVAFRLQTYEPPVSATSRAYAERLLALAPMQAWQRDALAETFREPAHEAELLEYGTITADLRATANP